jgi:Dolichyl-phosphate-mannose-protein mannosyltransferase
LGSPCAIIIYFAICTFLVHLLTSNGYGYFRDELYYLACGDHLDWGYVDMGPMAAWAARGSRLLFGNSLIAIRLLPAVAGAMKIVLTGLMAREFGGRRLAVVMACLCVLVGGYLALDSFLSMNAFEPVFWMGAAYAIVLAINRDEPRYWLLFGIAAGFGLENKHSILFFGFAVFVGLLLTPARRFFTDKWFWIGGLIAIVIFLPNIIWEYRHDWATIEVLQNVQREGKNVVLSPLAFIGQQIFILNPFTVPVWLAGLWYFLFDRNGRRFRMLGITYLTVLVLMIVLKGKNYYMLPVYPMLFAGGAVWWVKLLSGHRKFARLEVAYLFLIVVSGVVFAPFMVPVLPVETFLRYQKTLGLELPKSEVNFAGPLPQNFGDRFGWPEMVETVAHIYNNLPPDERAQTAIFGNNYGEAGAIDFFGGRYGLPKSISAHQNYYLWGPREYKGEEIILLQWNRARAERYCQRVEEAGTNEYPLAMADEHYTIFICHGLKRPLREIWPELKHWN